MLDEEHEVEDGQNGDQTQSGVDALHSDDQLSLQTLQILLQHGVLIREGLGPGQILNQLHPQIQLISIVHHSIHDNNLCEGGYYRGQGGYDTDSSYPSIHRYLEDLEDPGTLRGLGDVSALPESILSFDI